MPTTSRRRGGTSFRRAAAASSTPRRLAALLVAALVLGMTGLPPVAAVAESASPVPRPPAPTGLPWGGTKAGVASVDATWHLGASGGQFAAHEAPPGSNGVPGEEAEVPDQAPEQEYVDPFLHAKRKRPTRGLQSRIVTRAMVVEDKAGDRVAIVGNDLYLANDLVNRRVAQLLEQHDLEVRTGLKKGPLTGITEDNLAVTVSHNHNSAFYSTPSWGTWVFQDVFDLRFYDYIAGRMAKAVIDASADMRPVRIGAATMPFNEIQAHTIGPKVADDGTPAGQPFSHTTGMMTVVRVDDVTNPRKPKPYANWITLGLHPEWTWGYDLFSGDITHAAMRIIDRELGTTTVMSQRETGSSGPHKDLRVHEPHERREFQESGWQQLDAGARHWADAVHRAYDAIEAAEKPAPYNPHNPRTGGAPIELVPFRSNLDVSVVSERFAPPWTRPVPGISNCNTASLFHGNIQVPVLGLPDCNDDGRAVGEPIVQNTPFEEREVYDQLKEAGVPVPEAYFGTKFTGVEETAAVHLMAIRLGDIAATFCPCEQFTDTAINIQTRLDDRHDNIWKGWDWTTQKTPEGRDFCVPGPQEGKPEGTWVCADPGHFREPGPWPDLPPITDLEYRRMRAQINNDAHGWEELENATTQLGGEAEPADPAKIKGNYTHREITDYGAKDGYGLTIAVGMANDYFGYTPSYREMRGYDHYRKALNGLGLHGSDYLATRLVKLAASLKGGNPAELSPLDLAYQAESGRARVVSQALGELARAHVATYDATLPADGGKPSIIKQPANIARFDGTVVKFVGGSTYTDLPQIRVQRRVGNKWVRFADQSGEVQTEAKFPKPEELPAFAAGNFRWEWTASFEAFVSDIPLPDASGTVRRATPAGTYRFVIAGRHRQSAGDVVKRYHLKTAPFKVTAWKAITAGKPQMAGHSVRVAVGPRTTELFDERLWTFGAIDYPDTWSWEKVLTSVADKRSMTEKGAHGEHGNRVFYRYRAGTHDDQAYCVFCRFHPWLEEGAAKRGWITVRRADGTTLRREARVSGSQLVASIDLRPGDRVFVAAGDVRDPYGNRNGRPSPIVTVR